MELPYLILRDAFEEPGCCYGTHNGLTYFMVYVGQNHQIWLSLRAKLWNI